MFHTDCLSYFLFQVNILNVLDRNDLISSCWSFIFLIIWPFSSDTTRTLHFNSTLLLRVPALQVCPSLNGEQGNCSKHLQSYIRPIMHLAKLPESITVKPGENSHLLCSSWAVWLFLPWFQLLKRCLNAWVSFIFIRLLFMLDAVSLWDICHDQRCLWSAIKKAIWKLLTQLFSCQKKNEVCASRV